MRQINPTIRSIVEEACKKETNKYGYGIWSHHITLVVKYGKLLAKKLEADPEIVQIAALLHDYAGIKEESLTSEHHLHSAQEADNILRSLGYPEDAIIAVKQCIVSHRGSINIEKQTAEAVCLASADAIAHIDQIPSLFYLVFVQHQMEIDEGTAWVRAKLERSWNKLCPEGKEMIKEKYEAIQKIVQ
ncbi:HD domain-containing protein [Candidatus Poribacteria bacterium]|nr:HD domain-containing protein [Candidatus Poribacteria bacterium]